MKQENFRSAVPPVPEHFLEARERALTTICQKEEPEMKTSRKLTLSLAVALILVMCTAVGVAATQFPGILDFLNSENENIANSIQTHNQTFENEYFTGVIEQTYFDGINCLVTVRLSPVMPGTELLTTAMESGNDLSPLYAEGTLTFVGASGTYDCQGVRNDDGSLTLYLASNALEYIEEPVVELYIDLYSERDLTSDPICARTEITLSTPATPLLTSAAVVPAAESEHIQIECANLYISELNTLLEIKYSYPAKAIGEINSERDALEMASSASYIDVFPTNVEILPGASAIISPNVDGRTVRTVEYSLADTPSTITLNVLACSADARLGEGTILETIECEVVAE